MNGTQQKGLSLLLIAAALTWACSVHKHNCKDNSGISGQVFWLEGNLMPDPQKRDLSRKVQVKRQIVVCELMNIENLPGSSGPIFSGLGGHEIITVWTDESGHFNICMEPGTYSIFTIEEDGYFANRFDGEDHIQPVIVVEGQFTDITIDINYRAYY